MFSKSVKRMFLISAFVLVSAMHNVVIFASVPPPPELYSKSVILKEANTDTIIYETNCHEALPPASITKIMTLLLIYDACAEGRFKWDDPVTVSEHAASMGGSQVFLEPYETQTAADMTKCIAIASANDAAVAMAEFIGGSEEGFVAQMNEKAKELGMEDTHFVNACGLDADGHLSSAYDIALMSEELMSRYPEVKEYTTTWQDTITHNTKKGSTEFGLTNTNKLIKWYPSATGLKTGSTGKALCCLSGTAEKNGLSLVAVVMGAPDSKTRFREVMKLFDYGFSNYEMISGPEKGENMGEIPVRKGVADSVECETAEKMSFLHEKGSPADLTWDFELPETLTAPVEAGEVIGEVTYYINGEEVGRSNMITSSAVDKNTLKKTVKKLFGKWF
ncbi:MAG: D-alanyl-D-alanine carboxypeptidase [Firmicutes bacterium]|nr:D-alanyl-D-alanine carboxypeptidase [Bacillota bacterium]